MIYFDVENLFAYWDPEAYPGSSIFSCKQLSHNETVKPHYRSSYTHGRANLLLEHDHQNGYATFLCAVDFSFEENKMSSIKDIIWEASASVHAKFDGINLSTDESNNIIGEMFLVCKDYLDIDQQAGIQSLEIS